MTADDDQALVVLSRCADGPSAVPSRIVECERCHAPCWISKASGDATVAAARATGMPVILMCLECVICITGDIGPINVTPEALAETKDVLTRPEECALCGQPALGYAFTENGERLCHHDDRDCYFRWTIFGERP